jgi:NAD(P)-dependent dehydrogenase (short-subunit alcohol dehydrogenase family)
MMRLKDRVALVTGAGQGIGLACADALAREGAHVLMADLKEDAIRGEASRLAQGGARAAWIVCDVTRRDHVNRAVARAVSEFGRLDILVANAGIVHAAEFLDLEEADFDRVMAVNLKGVLLAGQAAARQMVKQGGGGAIVNMSSVNAVLAIPNQVPYVVSKGAVNQLTKVMAVALAPHGIRVNGIGPGTILTELARTAVLGNPEAER